MTKEQQAVTEFMLRAGQSVPIKPSLTDNITALLRVRLIQEELDELSSAIRNGDLIEIADGIGDLLYVVYGTACAFGIDADPVFNEIHRSNLSKFIDGHRRSDGKWIKGPSYSPASLATILKNQGAALNRDLQAETKALEG